MKQTILLFIAGVLIALMAVGGYLVARTYFVSADEDFIPQDIVIERLSPTTSTVSFTTAKAIIASIDCATSAEGPYSLCGAETQSSDKHEIKTSIILDPEKEYYFYIKIRNVTFDNLGDPFEIPVKADSEPKVFPTSLLGACTGDSDYDENYDINKDGCIRQNDKLLYLR